MDRTDIVECAKAYDHLHRLVADTASAYDSLHRHPGAVIAILGVLAEGVARSSEGTSTPVDPEDIRTVATYLRALRK